MAENVLGTIFGRADALKRQLYDMIRNPSDYASMVGGRTQENLATAQALQNQAFSDPQNPLRITNPQALNQLTQMITSGPLGFAPAGVMNVIGLPNRGRDIIQSSAEELSSKLRQLGFQADVTHSGSVAGPSSYVKVYDPETGRFFNEPIRFSGHSKGSFNQAEVRDVSDPTLDLPKIIKDALAMRSQGPSKLFQKQAIADELIASGMKPKQAYSEAEQRVAGLLEPQAVTKDLVKKSDFGVKQVSEKLESSGITADLSENDTLITLSRIVVPKEKRNTGIGTDAMQQIIDYADQSGKRVALSPSSDFGGSKERLKEFYKRFGFVENKGRNKDFSISETMYREPE